VGKELIHGHRSARRPRALVKIPRQANLNHRVASITHSVIVEERRAFGRVTMLMNPWPQSDSNIPPKFQVGSRSIPIHCGKRDVFGPNLSTFAIQESSGS
jgi:hypothetical protein